MSDAPRDGHVVSIVVPTLGRAGLADCEAALRAQTRPPDEIVIVHDPERRGVPVTRNEGLRRARGDLVGFMDDDCVPPPDWLARLVGAIDDWEADGAGGTYTETDPLLRAIRARRERPAEAMLDPGGLVGVGGNVLYRREWLERLAQADGHVFNPSLGTGEDWELAWRLRRAGARLVFVPVGVEHRRRVSPMRHWRQQFARGRGIALLYHAHRAAGTSVVAQPSRIWRSGGARWRDWAGAAWHKGLGPFGLPGSPGLRAFVVFWVGVKCEGAGFVYQLILGRLGRRAAPSAA